MGLFDFFKKGEFAKIKSLENEIASLQSQLVIKEALILQLQMRVETLVKYSGVVDAELEAKHLVKQAHQQAQNIINKAIEESDVLKLKASQILIEAQEKLDVAQIESLDRKAVADNEISNLLSDARKKALELRNNANDVLGKANSQASEIITRAETRAQEIAGDAYRAKNEAEDLSKTIAALKNTINGYGDQYLVPSYSLLDQLADDFSYIEAGKQLEKAREASRLMVKYGTAAKCDYVEDNRRTTAINFITDAFNGKVDTILANVKQDNFGTLQQKIKDAYQLVNNLGRAFRNAVIAKGYLDSRIEELKWAVVVTELRNLEREEQRRIKEQIREEERAKREFEKAIKDAEKEEDTIKKALDKATKELEAASDEQKQKYEAKLAELNERLKIAEEKGQRALSMAQQTKSGHVYIISNIGSFGENIYKIGMTRRLEPEDRIKELGDASVPFSFDIHAMIYSNNAPSLETELHRYFVDNQLNKVNPRKEFFKVGLKDIRNKVESLNLQSKWTMMSQAAEYRESLAIEKEMNTNESKHKEWEDLQLRRLSA